MTTSSTLLLFLGHKCDWKFSHHNISSIYAECCFVFVLLFLFFLLLFVFFLLFFSSFSF